MKLKSNATYVFKIGNKFIVPGFNILNKEEEKKLMAHSSVVWRIEKGVFEIDQEKKPAKKAAKKAAKKEDFVAGLEELTAKEFSKEVVEIFDIALLEKIIRTDSRVTVQRAAQAQLDKLRGEDE